MVSCGEFRRHYSDYRDGYLDPADSESLREHAAACGSCTRYERALELGVGELNCLPRIEPSSDFLQRLQHRIYHIDEERAAQSRRDGSGSSTFVLALVLLISAAAWVPLAKERAAVVQLPAVVASAPESTETLPELFREGPLLVAKEPQSELLETRPLRMSRYSPLGSYASYRPGLARPR